MACDICSKTGTDLTNLLDSYKTDEIQSICPECTRIVNAQLSKLKSVTHNMLTGWMKRFMKEQKEKKNAS